MSRHNLRYGSAAPGPAYECIPARRIKSPSAPSHSAQGKIGGDLHIFGANPLPNSIEVKWEGAGIDTDWTIPTNTLVRRNDQLAFHMEWVAFQPGLVARKWLDIQSVIQAKAGIQPTLLRIT